MVWFSPKSLSFATPSHFTPFSYQEVKVTKSLVLWTWFRTLSRQVQDVSLTIGVHCRLFVRYRHNQPELSTVQFFRLFRLQFLDKSVVLWTSPDYYWWEKWPEWNSVVHIFLEGFQRIKYLLISRGILGRQNLGDILYLNHYHNYSFSTICIKLILLKK